MNPRVCLIIACYGGARRLRDDLYNRDRAIYLKAQMQSLNFCRHEWTTPVFMSTGGTVEYMEYLMQIPYAVGHRQNLGMSYGSWSLGYNLYRDQCDYFIFIEDDYFFVRDDFDKVMVEMFNSFPDCGYLCSLSRRDPRIITHPNISNGISSAAVLAKIYDKDGGLPGAAAVGGYSDAELNGQLRWGHACLEVGKQIYDMGARFKAPFQRQAGNVHWHYPKAPEMLLVPFQIFREMGPRKVSKCPNCGATKISAICSRCSFYS